MVGIHKDIQASTAGRRRAAVGPQWGGFQVEKFQLFNDMAERTGGSVYIGVVGPVRTGKSTFIKRFMDLLVLPEIRDAHVRKRTEDELPQSGAGRTVMTTQPLFVPDEPVPLQLGDGAQAKVRLVDCVGYSVEGARGFEDETGPRMVRTPWFDEEIPFERAAEVGTRKVIAEHSTVGIVVTTDGSVTDLPREAYVPAEERVVAELKELGKPFIVVINTSRPDGEETLQLAQSLREAYGVAVVPLDCLHASAQSILEVLQELLFEFPVRELGLRLPDWVAELDEGHWLKERFVRAAWEALGPIAVLRDVEGAVEALTRCDGVERVTLRRMDLGTGRAEVELGVAKALFYQVLQEMTGFDVQGDHHLVRLMQELAAAKREYDKIAEALDQVREEGYGIVAPRLEDIMFDEPEIIRKGGQFGVRLRASAPSIHLVKASIVTEVTPIVGTERQGEELARYFMEEFEKDSERVWTSQFLGTSLQDLVREGIQSKLYRIPEHAQRQLQRTLTKIVNEGSGGLIVIIL